MPQNTKRLDEILTVAPVIPVITIKDSSNAVPLARALVKGWTSSYRNYIAYKISD